MGNRTEFKKSKMLSLAVNDNWKQHPTKLQQKPSHRGPHIDFRHKSNSGSVSDYLPTNAFLSSQSQNQGRVNPRPKPKLYKLKSKLGLCCLSQIGFGFKIFIVLKYAFFWNSCSYQNKNCPEHCNSCCLYHGDRCPAKSQFCQDDLGWPQSSKTPTLVL